MQRKELWIGISFVIGLTSWIALDYFDSAVWALLGFGLVYGALTGLAMRWLLQFPRSASEPVSDFTTRPQASLDTMRRLPQTKSIKKTFTSLNWRLVFDWLKASSLSFLLGGGFLISPLIWLILALLAIIVTIPVLLIFKLRKREFPSLTYQRRVLTKLGLTHKHWRVLSSIGWLVAISLVGVLAIITLDTNQPTYITILLAALFGAIIGIFVGTAQWISLRHDLDRAKLWIWGNGIGLALGWGILAGLAVVLPSTEIIFAILGVLFYGLLKGVFLAWLAPQAAIYPLVTGQRSKESKQIKKNIRDMRQMFGFFGILTAIYTLLTLITIFTTENVVLYIQYLRQKWRE